MSNTVTENGNSEHKRDEEEEHIIKEEDEEDEEQADPIDLETLTFLPYLDE